MPVPAVTVLMNCHNGAKYLPEAVDSVLSQTISDWELIFWDNQSTDNSAAIAQAYRDSRIHYYLAPNHTSLGIARQRAIQKARGRWIGVLDTDDVWLPNKLERQLGCAKEKPEAGLIYGRTESFAEEGGKARLGVNPPLHHPMREGHVFKQLACNNFMSLVSILYRREFMEEIGGFREFQIAADYDLSLRLSLLHPVAAVDEIICRYRWHSSNTSHKMLEVGIIEVEEILSDLSQEPGAVEGLSFWQANHAICHLMAWRLSDAYKALLKADKVEFSRLVLRGVRRRVGRF